VINVLIAADAARGERKMKTFTIENETNNITLHASGKEAETVPDSERFTNEAALARLAANWPAARLVEIWNSLPGAIPVRRFKDRATAVSRLWKAIQDLGQSVPAAEEPGSAAEMPPLDELPEATLVPDAAASGQIQPEAVTPETMEPAVATAVAPQTPDVAPREAPATTKATRAKKAPVAATNAGVPRENSKTSQVIAMLKREGGVTLEELMTKFHWQAHTTRSMLSAGGPLIKKHGLVITSEKVGDKRTYCIKA
jgi:hypothetical protein